MKKIFIMTGILLFVFSLSVIAEGWSKSLMFAITLNQSKSKAGVTGAMSENGTLNYGILINGELTKDNEKINWTNTLKLEFARNKTENNDVYTEWTEDKDKLTLDSVYRWKTWIKFNPYAALNLQTAMLDSNYAGEWKAFRPLQVRESGGLSSPILAKETQTLLVRLGLFNEHYINKPTGVDMDSSNGIELVFDYKNQLKKDTLFTSKLGFYSSLKETDDPAGTNWNSDHKSKKIKMEFDNTLVTKIAKYINLNLSYNIQNIDITEKETHYEWEEILNIAFNYKVF